MAELNVEALSVESASVVQHESTWARVRRNGSVRLGGIALLLLLAVALAFGILFGLMSGFLRWLDGPLMRVMDGLMAIPAILISSALVAMWKGSLLTVVIAIAIPEIPRGTRLVRSLVLSIREEPYVEAAISLGTPTPLIMWRHILP
ncbi:MAG: ABC transporter permease subunit, partial [Rubrivivax sp.]|nr:ABC transporter permease subunit [Rubrivivax sp.]